MQIKTGLETFGTSWAVAVSEVRGGFDKDAFLGVELTGAETALDAGTVVVTGTRRARGAPRLAMHIAAAMPGSEKAQPVRLLAGVADTGVDFLERVERYARADRCTRLRMALTETRGCQPERLADIERELMLLDEHRHAKRRDAPPSCAVATSWEAARSERQELVRRRDAHAALEHTLAMALQHDGSSKRYEIATLLAQASSENADTGIGNATAKALHEALLPSKPSRRPTASCTGEPEQAPPTRSRVVEEDFSPDHPSMRLRHPAAAWAKVVKTIEPRNGRGGFAFEGHFLTRDAQNDVPLGAILVTGHDVGSRRHPRRERIAALVCSDPEGVAMRIPLGSDANRSDLDFRDYVAGYLAAPPRERAARLLEALLAGDPGPDAASAMAEVDHQQLKGEYANVLRTTMRKLGRPT